MHKLWAGLALSLLGAPTVNTNQTNERGQHMAQFTETKATSGSAGGWTFKPTNTSRTPKDTRQSFAAGRTIRKGGGQYLYTADLYRLSHDGTKVIHDLVEQFGPGAVLARLQQTLHNLAIEAEQQDNPKADLFRHLRHIVSVAYTTSEQTTTAIYEGRD